MLSAHYAQALETMRQAEKVYRMKAEQYHARIISDETYLAARAIWKQAEAAFDAAYEREVKEA